MRVNGLVASINTPHALKSEFILTCECGNSWTTNPDPSRRGKTCPKCKSKKITVKEKINDLPPHDEQPAYIVDEYPACPEDWMHGSTTAGSYFVPTKTGRGMWFDFTGNMSNRHHVAIVISVQGINAITGHPTNKKEWLGLQQIKNKCPIHNCKLGHNRYCEE